MKMHTRTAIVGLALSSLFVLAWPRPSAAGAPTRVRAQILETGSFHGDEVRARSGQRWLGLFANARRSELRAVTVNVDRVHDSIVDENERVKTGKRVRVRGRERPKFLVRGSAKLGAGPVETVLSAETPLTNRADITLTLDGTAYRLWVSTEAPSPSEAIERNDAELCLSAGGRRQVLYSLRGRDVNEAYWNVLWAGDADGDGRLDLYVTVSHHYNVSEQRLYLSSDAGRGEIVGKTASFVTVGC